MSLGAMIPALAQVAGPVIADALGEDHAAGIAPIVGLPGLEIRASLAESQMKDPGFWQDPGFDWKKMALAALVGFIAGSLLARTMK